MNLLEIYEENKKEKEVFENQKKEHEFKKELKRLISSIIEGRDCFYTNNEELIEKLNIKAKKETKNNFTINMYDYHGYSLNSFEYVFDLNKTNIQKVQKYIDEEK